MPKNCTFIQISRHPIGDKSGEKVAVIRSNVSDKEIRREMENSVEMHIRKDARAAFVK